MCCPRANLLWLVLKRIQSKKGNTMKRYLIRFLDRIVNNPTLTNMEKRVLDSIVPPKEKEKKSSTTVESV